MTPGATERRKQARLLRARRKAIERAEAQERAERLAEELAPAIQRHAINGIRGPRLIVSDGRMNFSHHKRAFGLKFDLGLGGICGLVLPSGRDYDE